VNKLPDWSFSVEQGRATLARHFGTQSMKGFGFEDDDPALAAAGADPDKIGGWLHGTVEMMEGARKFQVKKLLRPFDLK